MKLDRSRSPFGPLQHAEQQIKALMKKGNPPDERDAPHGFIRPGLNAVRLQPAFIADDGSVGQRAVEHALEDLTVLLGNEIDGLGLHKSSAQFLQPLIGRPIVF
jgi:hypothetical protein